MSRFSTTSPPSERTIALPGVLNSNEGTNYFEGPTIAFPFLNTKKGRKRNTLASSVPVSKILLILPVWERVSSHRRRHRWYLL